MGLNIVRDASDFLQLLRSKGFPTEHKKSGPHYYILVFADDSRCVLSRNRAHDIRRALDEMLK